MTRLLWIMMLVMALSIQVSASGIVAPEVPDDVEQLLPSEREDFGNSVWHLLKKAAAQAQPQVASGLKICFRVLGSILILTLLCSFGGNSKSVAELAGVLVVACILLSNSNDMIEMGTNTVWRISQYGKLLLPVMTAALAAQGGSASATSMYAATTIFDTVLSSMVSSVLIPAVYIYIVLAILNAAMEDALLKKLKDLIKWGMTWFLKILLYVFTGYISITGIISGVADQTAVKATKLTISGMVPVVGGILSDAAETILVSANIAKSTVGTYGLLAIIAVTILPFLSIGVHYLLLKTTAAISSVFTSKTMAGLLEDFSAAMGLVLGMTGAVCLIQLISIVCFMKGMT